VALLRIFDGAAAVRGAPLRWPPVFVIVLLVQDQTNKPQHWSRTELDAELARELYDTAVAEFIAEDEPEPSFVSGGV